MKSKPDGFFWLAQYRIKHLGDTHSAFEPSMRYIAAVDSGYEDSLDRQTMWRLSQSLGIVAKEFLKSNKPEDGIKYAMRAYGIVVNSEERADFAKIAMECAIAMKDTVRFKEFAIKAASAGGVSTVYDLLAKAYPNDDPKARLKIIFEESASKCDSVRGLVVVSDEGDTFKVGEGVITVFDFWGPGCQPCVEEMPILIRFAGQFKGKPIQWLAITNSSKSYFKKHPFRIDNWEFCSDQQKTFRAIVKIGAIPQFYIIDGKGRIRYSRIGSFDGPSLKTPREVLEMLIGEG
jgi:thiol-disulfide isomerase/thioredoxin